MTRLKDKTGKQHQTVLVGERLLFVMNVCANTIHPNICLQYLKWIFYCGKAGKRGAVPALNGLMACQVNTPQKPVPEYGKFIDRFYRSIFEI